MTYSPNLGRWLQVDPKGFDAGDTNLYRYVFNNPIIYTDPDGLEVRLYLHPVRRFGKTFGDHVQIVAGGDGAFVTYDGGGERSVNPQTGRPAPSRQVVGGFPQGDYFLAKSPYKSAQEEIDALDKVYRKLRASGKNDSYKKFKHMRLHVRRRNAS